MFKTIISNRDTSLAKTIDFNKYLDTGDNGIDTTSIESRVETHGKNDIPKIPPKTFGKILWEACKDPLIGILAFSGTVALIFGTVFEEQRNRHEWIEGIAIWFTICVVVCIGAYNNYKQERAFHKLNSKNDEYSVKVIRDGSEQQISNKSLVVGDLVILESGDKVPADGYLVETFSLGLDESALTGETITVYKDFETDPWFRSGSVVTEGHGKMYVIAVGKESEYGRTLALVQKKTAKTPLQRRINRFVKWCGIVASIISIAVFIGLTIRWAVTEPRTSISEGPLRFIVFSISILVVGLPEGLPAAVLITLTTSIKKMMNDHLFVRHLSACETLGSTSMLLSDKTGTMTENKMTVMKIVVCDKMFDHLPPIGNMGAIFDDIFVNCSINSTAFIKDNIGIGSQTEVAMINFINFYGKSYENIRAEYKSKITAMTPFSSKTKMSSTEVDGCRYTKGASEIILSMCDSVAVADGTIELTPELREIYTGYINSLASTGLRTIGISKNTMLLCIFGIKDPVRKSVPFALKMCENAGIGVVMVTGDNIQTAKHIASEIDMLKFGDIVIEGKEFRAMSKDERIVIAPKLKVLARSSPEDKYELVQLMKDLGHVVASSGDGANDAPALKEADVGCAMGSGTDIAKESADIVILNDDFESIVNGVKWGRSIMSNIRSFISFQVAINIIALIVVSTAAFAKGETPLNVVQLLYVNLVMDSIAAVALTATPPSDKLMSKKPGHRDQFVITFDMLRSIIPQSVYQIVVQLTMYFITPTMVDTNIYQLSGFMFNTFIFCQIFNLVNVASPDSVFPILKIYRKKVLMLCIVLMVGVQVSIMFLLGTVFKTEDISANMWVISVGIGFGSSIVHVVTMCVHKWLQDE